MRDFFPSLTFDRTGVVEERRKILVGRGRFLRAEKASPGKFCRRRGREPQPCSPRGNCRVCRTCRIALQQFPQRSAPDSALGRRNSKIPAMDCEKPQRIAEALRFQKPGRLLQGKFEEEELKRFVNRYIVVTLRDLAAPGLPATSPLFCLITRAQHVCIQTF
jgi:hypothetical protein